MKKKIRIAIVDFAPTEAYLAERLLGMVSDRYVFEITEDNPDFVLHSYCGQRALLFDGVRIFYTAENLSADFNISDYAMGMDRISFGDRYIRLPLYRLYPNTYPELFKKRSAPKEPRPEFCTGVVSNAERDKTFFDLYDALSKYQHVASGGKLLNNVGGRVPDKVEFMKAGRFGLAMENTIAPGYITEKITDVYAAGAIPIYFGSPDISLDFNPKSYVDVSAYDSISDAVEAVKKIDRNPELYNAMCSAPIFNTSVEPVDLNETLFSDFLSNIFDQSVEDAYRRNRIAVGYRYHKAMKTAFFKPHVQMSRLYRAWSRKIRNRKHFTAPNEIK